MSSFPSLVFLSKFPVSDRRFIANYIREGVHRLRTRSALESQEKAVYPFILFYALESNAASHAYYTGDLIFPACAEKHRKLTSQRRKPTFPTMLSPSNGTRKENTFFFCRNSIAEYLGILFVDIFELFEDIFIVRKAVREFVFAYKWGLYRL